MRDSNDYEEYPKDEYEKEIMQYHRLNKKLEDVVIVDQDKV